MPTSSDRELAVSGDTTEVMTFLRRDLRYWLSAAVVSVASPIDPVLLSLLDSSHCSIDCMSFAGGGDSGVGGRSKPGTGSPRSNFCSLFLCTSANPAIHHVGS